MSVNEDSVRIQISKDDGASSDGSSMQTTIGKSAGTSAQASNFLQGQLSSLSNRSISVLGRQITFREIIFILVAVILTSTALGLTVSVVLANESLDYETKMATCNDYDCYKSAAAVQRKVNDTVDPCDNFYQYSCKQWIDRQDLLGNQRQRTILSELEVENLKRLNDAIEGEIDPMRRTDWAFESKLQRMYQGCLNQYQTTTGFTDTYPLLVEIYNMGGWYVFGSLSFNPSRFDWPKAHRENLGTTNWIDAVFYWDVEPWDQRHEAYYITIREDITPFPFWKWNIPGSNYEAGYRTLLTSVAKIFARDFGLSTSTALNDRINNFVEDVLAVERVIAEAQKANENELGSNNNVQFKILSGIQPFASGFNWVRYFQSVMKETKRPIDGLTLAAVKIPNTLAAITKGFSSGVFGTQQWNNYLVWRLIYSWLPDLPYEYNHHYLKWHSTLNDGALEYKPSWTFCMERARIFMRDALDGLYVRKHFSPLDKSEIVYVSENLRKSVADEVTRLDWMDDATRKTASEKVAKTQEKLGYPDFIDSELSMQNALDFAYRKINMTTNNHFSNMQQLRQHHRVELVDIYTYARDPESDWRETPLYSTGATYFYPWNEMVVPAGLLQFPIFSGYNPTMYRVQTYGSAGFMLARGYLYGIGESGQYFDKYGNLIDNKDRTWWSAETTKNYGNKKQCLTDWYKKVQTDILVLDNGEKVQKHLQDPASYASRAIIDIGALRNAYAAYVSPNVQSDSRTANERYLPGVSAKSKQEYFFLSFAQSMCAVRDDQVTYNLMTEASTWLPEELMVNNLLMNLPEFSSVFQCPAGSKMNPGPCSPVF